MREESQRRRTDLEISSPRRNRLTVSGACVGDLCLACGVRVQDISAEESITLAWCGCAFAEDHHEMEVL